jgi:hypothetical protein
LGVDANASDTNDPLRTHCGWLIQTHGCYAEPLVNKHYSIIHFTTPD